MEHCISRKKFFSFLLELITFATGKKEIRAVSPPYQPTNSLFYFWNKESTIPGQNIHGMWYNIKSVYFIILFKFYVLSCKHLSVHVVTGMILNINIQVNNSDILLCFKW